MTVRALILALMLVLPVTVEAQASAISYQGYLTEAGTAAEGAYDFELALYNVGTGGNAIDVNAYDNVAVTGGLFQLAADFTAAPFESGGSYWVEARVRDGDETGAYTPLLPRQPVSASPYAIAAQAVIAPLDVAGNANVQGTLTVDGDIRTINEVRAGRVEADEIWTDGPVDLLGGAVIQRFGDSTALVVANAGPTQPAARVDGNLEVGGALECSGSECVPLDSLQAGSYRSRSELYVATQSNSVIGGLNGSATAFCDDANDRPLAGACPSTSLFLLGFDLIDWEVSAQPAAYRCRFNNPTTVTIGFTVKLVCISVP